MMLVFATSSGALLEKKSIESFDGTEISYFIEGKGEPVLVFIHGWSCEKTYWEYQINEFSGDYTVVALDLAGHGESGVTRKNYKGSYKSW